MTFLIAPQTRSHNIGRLVSTAVPPRNQVLCGAFEQLRLLLAKAVLRTIPCDVLDPHRPRAIIAQPTLGSHFAIANTGEDFVRHYPNPRDRLRPILSLMALK